MKTTSFQQTTFRSALITAGFVFALAGTTAYADSTDAAPQPHSDGVAATLSDAAITTKIKASLIGDKRLKRSDISVTTTNGVVTLNGSASSSDAKMVAEAKAKSVDGVKSVDDDLTTPAGSEASSTAHTAVAKTKRVASDSWITTKVKSEILADSVSKGFDVSVKTSHGVVLLKGSLASQDAIDHVKDITEKVKGVKSVDTSALVVASK